MANSSPLLQVGVVGAILLSSCGSSVSLSPDPNSVALISTPANGTGSISLLSPIPPGVSAGEVVIDVDQKTAVPATIYLSPSTPERARFSRQALSPSDRTLYRVRRWDRDSLAMDLGGVDQIEAAGLDQACVILRYSFWRGGQEVSRSLGCEIMPSPTPGPSPTPAPSPSVTPIPTPPPSPGPTPTPPPGGEMLMLDQVSLTADTFFLTQTTDTGVVGFGPVFGPRAVNDDFGGPGSSAFPDNGIRQLACGLNSFFQGGVAPILLVNQELGRVRFTRDGVLAPSTTLGVAQPNSVTLSNQRLFVLRNDNGQTTLQLSPANFDEIYRINYFESRTLTFRTATCEITDQGATLSFSETMVDVEGVLGSATVLLTLRGTTGGINEPDQGLLQAAAFLSDAPLPEGLVATADPRFAGVLNLRDVSDNPIRTDAALIFDQVAGQPTQGAIRQLPIGPGFSNPASGSPPFVTGSVQRDGQQCPAAPDFVCGRFQFNQPFPQTAGLDGDGVNPDVLLIVGTFVGRLR